MFEVAEVGNKIDAVSYEQAVPRLREALLAAQFELAQQSKFPVIILIAGVDGAGKGETVNLLNEWMDPRHIQVHAMSDDSDDAEQHPAMWRYWQALPPKGKIGIFFSSWYTNPILARVLGKGKLKHLNESIQAINHFETMLSKEGALIIKLWFHLSKVAQKTRLKALEKNPKTRWRVTKQDWQHYKHYNQFRHASQHTLLATSNQNAPWMIIEGSDSRYRSLTAGNILLAALRQRLTNAAPQKTSKPTPTRLSSEAPDVFKTLDMSQQISDKKFATQLERYQRKLHLLTRDQRFAKLSVIAVFEGSDAAGKGGAIRRITGALDARHYRTVPIAAPTEEERAQPYLWRFWRHIPRVGHFAIFDRSWYGRVLVERVENFCSEADWQRAYSEINDFETQLVASDTVLVKFWLTVSKEEQLKRFQAREAIGFKRFKITADDWRNRERWDDYQAAVCDMVYRTSNKRAPWVMVEANDKNFARIKVLKTLCQHIEAALKKQN
jgi:AMP-polyphosphate phosphotransferase